MLAAATTVDSPTKQRAVSKVLVGEKMPSLEQGTMEWTHLYFLMSGLIIHTIYVFSLVFMICMIKAISTIAYISNILQV